QRVLVPEVVEDRASRHSDRLLQTPNRRLVVAVFGEATASTVEDLTAASRQMVLADLRHGMLGWAWGVSRTSACCAARTAGCRRCGSSRPHRGCRCAPWRRTRSGLSRPWSL